MNYRHYEFRIPKQNILHIQAKRGEIKLQQKCEIWLYCEFFSVDQIWCAKMVPLSLSLSLHVTKIACGVTKRLRVRTAELKAS